MTFLYPHAPDLDALRARVALGNLTREEALAALAKLLDVAAPDDGAESEPVNDPAQLTLI